jgi:hypothetical protein
MLLAEAPFPFFRNTPGEILFETFMSTQTSRWLGGVACLAGLAAAVGGCDPGWNYRPVTGTRTPDENGLYAVPAGDGRVAGVNVWLFGGSLNVEFHVDGLSSGNDNALRLSVLDRSGIALRPSLGAGGSASCVPSAALAGKFHCTLSGDYPMQPAGGCTWNHPGKKITVLVEGADAGNRLSFRVPMEAE